MPGVFLLGGLLRMLKKFCYHLRPLDPRVQWSLMNTGLKTHKYIALVSLAALSLLLTACEADKPKPNVLIVTFDTTRADHIGAYGNPNKPSPTIDGLAAEGTLFEYARSTVPITLPSHSTIMTGKYPPGHGVRDNGLFVLDDGSNLTLAEILKAEGYATGAAIASFPLTSQFGLDQGFDYYNDHVTTAWEDESGQRDARKESIFFDERPAESVNAAIVPWIKEHHAEPFFAFVHYFDPHQPLEAPPAFAAAFPTSAYDAEIAYADAALGQLLDELDALGVLDNTIVVVTSDHGEGHGEHNETTHSLLNYDSTLRVPLVMRIPGTQPHRVDRAVGTVDIMPTLLDALDISAPEGMHGDSLMPLVETGVAPDWFPEPRYYAETLSPRVAHNWGELRTLISDQHKYIFGPRPELYHWRDDRWELNDLTVEDAELAADMQQELADWLGSLGSATPSEAVAIDEETLDRLQSLGYIQGDGNTGEIVETLRGDGIAPQDRVHHVSNLSLAKSSLAAGQWQEAKLAINRLLEEDPDNKAYLYIASAVAIGMGERALARGYLESMVETDGLTKASADSVLKLVGIMVNAGEVDQGLSMLETHLAAKPSAQGFYRLAMYKKRRGDIEPAKSAFRRAIELEPKDYVSRKELAILLDRDGDAEGADRLFQEALELQPYFANLHYNYGVFALTHGQTEVAVERFDRAIMLAENYLVARHAAAVLAIQAGDFEKAQAHITWFESHAPESSHATELFALMEGNRS